VVAPARIGVGLAIPSSKAEKSGILNGPNAR